MTAVMPAELILPLTIAAVVAVLCWVLSLVFDEYSWVDRSWSIVPEVYVGTFAYQADFADARLNLMFALTTLWGARLTFNYARKGGYAKGGEDYRWRILKERMTSWQWQLFNIFFIHLYQHTLLVLIALPAWAAFQHRGAPLGVIDGVAAVLFLALLVGEFIADQQQWDFHQAKQTRKAAGEPEPKGFLDTGLWAWSRHPNFFCEISQWWVLVLFPIAASGTVVQPTAGGAFMLTLLFFGSAWFTEWITASKYPAYAEYQRRVPQLLPRPPR
jgi:steroid 5-alpha reductase family enzyme